MRKRKWKYWPVSEKVPAPKSASVSYYEPKERRTAKVATRATPTLKKSVEDLARLWTHMERVHTPSGEEPKEVTESDVVLRLLQVGLDGAWAEVGGRPSTEKEWEQLLQTIEKRAPKSSR